MEKKFKVYKHIFPNNKIYIGITCQDVRRRWRDNGKGYKYQGAYIWRAIQKYGWENIKHEILFENLTKEEACQKEIELIKEFKSNDYKFGYNINSGGENGPTHLSEETKKKISQSLIGNTRAKGKKWTEEQKQRIRELNKNRNYDYLKGRKMPESVKKWRSELWKGENNPNYHNKLSEEVKLKRSLALKGRSCWCKGKKMSEESRKKMSEAKKGKPTWNKGIPCSEETKRKISEAKKRNNASRNI